jgi:hypothetical protein
MAACETAQYQIDGCGAQCDILATRSLFCPATPFERSLCATHLACRSHASFAGVRLTQRPRKSEMLFSMFRWRRLRRPLRRLKGPGSAIRGILPRRARLDGRRWFRAQTHSGLFPLVQTLQSSGATTLEALTRGLNERGVRSARGARWHVSSVANLLSRTHRLAEVR